MNNLPFCCQYCVTFVASYRYSLESLYCPECFNTICPRCIIETFPDMKLRYLERYIPDGYKY